MSNSFIDPSLLGPAGSSSAAPSSAPVPPAGAAPGGQSAPPAQQPQASTSAVSAEAAEAAKKADEAKKAEERARKDRTLVEFMQMLDGYDPVVRRLARPLPELASPSPPPRVPQRHKLTDGLSPVAADP